MILTEWESMAPKFVKVMPKDYKRMLASIRRVTDAGLSGEEALMAAFNENAKDVARVGGG
jgi:glutamate synthase (ferredoxin)